MLTAGYKNMFLSLYLTLCSTRLFSLPEIVPQVFFPVKRMFFFPRVAKGLVTPGCQVVGVFSLLPYSIKHVEVTVVRLNDK